MQLARTTTVTAPHDLRADLQPSAVGVRLSGPNFSWMVPPNGDGLQQRCRVQVALDPDGFEHPDWDSGTVESSGSTGVPYAGPELRPSTPYWWRVRTWAADASEWTAESEESYVESEDWIPRPSDWSRPARFITANDGWHAQPIWGPEASGADQGSSWVLLRTEFGLPDRPVRTAFVEAAGLSPEGGRQYVYKLWANGTVVGRGSVRSGTEQARYHTHDVSEHLAPGTNALAALCWAEDGRQFVARLVVVFEDGQRLEVPTSTRWRALGGASMLPGTATIEGGWYRAPQENWDLRAEPAGWTGAGFDDRDWASAVPSATELPAPAPATVNIEQYAREPATVTRTSPGHWFVDLGREIAGGLRLDVVGRDGQEIDVRLGEELEAGRVRSRMRTGNVYEETWTLRDGRQTVEHWGYRAFRYAELVADPDVDLSGAVTAVVLRSPGEDAGVFVSSSPELDRVWEFCRYSIEATSLDLYMDTPARERGPYEGDMLVNQLSQYAVDRRYALARYSGEYLTRRPTWPAEYHLMPAVIAWQDYLHTGDDRQLRSDFELWEELSYDRFVRDDHLLHKSPGESSQWDADLVDWPEVSRDDYVFTEVNTVTNAFQWAAYAALSRIASVIGRADRAEHYRDRADRMRGAMNDMLLGPDRAAYRDGLGTDHAAQHATAIPVALGLAPEDALSALGVTLARDGMRTSVYGAQFLLQALYAAGRSDAAHALMTSSSPAGWLHLLDSLGATIVGEAWDPALKPNMTFSHAWGTAPANIISRWTLGVRDDLPGGARVTVHPRPGPLTWMAGTVPTMRGKVLVEFSRDSRTLRVVVPTNTTARLVLERSELGFTGSPTVRGSGRLVIDGAQDRYVVSDVRPGETIVSF